MCRIKLGMTWWCHVFDWLISMFIQCSMYDRIAHDRLLSWKRVVDFVRLRGQTFLPLPTVHFISLWTPFSVLKQKKKKVQEHLFRNKGPRVPFPKRKTYTKKLNLSFTIKKKSFFFISFTFLQHWTDILSLMTLHIHH